uniref:Uncharacterized protein n=2 Tax=Glossina palpalis gambiensis TaxID=67801 RepID=A0A1B0C5K3_9MUSC
MAIGFVLFAPSIVGPCEVCGPSGLCGVVTRRPLVIAIPPPGIPAAPALAAAAARPLTTARDADDVLCDVDAETATVALCGIIVLPNIKLLVLPLLLPKPLMAATTTGGPPLRRPLQPGSAYLLNAVSLAVYSLDAVNGAIVADFAVVAEKHCSLHKVIVVKETIVLEFEVAVDVEANVLRGGVAKACSLVDAIDDDDEKPIDDPLILLDVAPPMAAFARAAKDGVISGIVFTMGGVLMVIFFGGFFNRDASILLFSQSLEGRSSERLAAMPSSGSFNNRFRVIAGSFCILSIRLKSSGPSWPAGEAVNELTNEPLFDAIPDVTLVLESDLCEPLTPLFPPPPPVPFITADVINGPPTFVVWVEWVGKPPPPTKPPKI